jgi:hypothetical protein
MVRSFNLAHLRILIYHQNRVQTLESKVLDRDKRYAAMPKDSVEYKKLRGAQFILRKQDDGESQRLEYNINEDRKGDIMEEDRLLLELEEGLKRYRKPDNESDGS